MVFNKESEESVFNMAFAYLKRIDKLLYFCQESGTKQDIDAWLNYLRAVYRELAVKLTTDEEQEILGKREDGKADLSNPSADDATFLKINPLIMNPEIKVQNKGQILFLLDQLDVRIRRKLQQKGMLLPSKGDPRFAVLKR